MATGNNDDGVIELFSLRGFTIIAIVVIWVAGMTAYQVHSDTSVQSVQASHTTLIEANTAELSTIDTDLQTIQDQLAAIHQYQIDHPPVSK